MGLAYGLYVQRTDRAEPELVMAGADAGILRGIGNYYWQGKATIGEFPAPLGEEAGGMAAPATPEEGLHGLLEGTVRVVSGLPAPARAEAVELLHAALVGIAAVLADIRRLEKHAPFEWRDNRAENCGAQHLAAAAGHAITAQRIYLSWTPEDASEGYSGHLRRALCRLAMAEAVRAQSERAALASAPVAEGAKD